MINRSLHLARHNRREQILQESFPLLHERRLTFERPVLQSMHDALSIQSDHIDAFLRCTLKEALKDFDQGHGEVG
ncbi:BQ5605_C034g11260 [Microbotryum silenes-dioicae]|uniref:BQ5605_C034g11260 protein n=1 Tax=Microbotryum silenes-dioicae TaxID=796604 RepID=A0A2X0MJ81_9BASI|nr:BQ5605_C034g11260 [Microbotryum silenes-dioicae]